MTFRITNSATNQWIVEQEVFDSGWFRKIARWERMAVCASQKEALAIVQLNANFEPHTSYYDKYGNLIIADTAW